MTYIATRCRRCNNHIILLEEELSRTKTERYLVCSYCSNKDIAITDKYEDLIECMQKKTIYSKVNGKVKQK